MIYLLLCKTKGKEFTRFLYLTILFWLLIPRIFSLVFAFALYITIIFIWYLLAFIKVRRNNYFRTYFGVPGSGKSTIGTFYALEQIKKNKNNEKRNLKRIKKGKKPIPIKKIYSNISIPGTIMYDKSDISILNEDLKDCLLIYDEVGIDFNNRNFIKNFDSNSLKLFKYHRKRNIDIMIFSQSYEDMDKKLRDLSTELYFLKKSLLPFFIKSNKIKKYIEIDKETHQIVDGYKKELFSGFYVFMPKTWKYFDTKEEK